MSSWTTLNRRTLLRGVGVTMALPLLEGMMTTSVSSAALQAKRLQIFYTPNGMHLANYVPKQAGVGYEMTPILKPLEALRDSFSVVTGLQQEQANSLGDGPGDHGRACGTHLTAVHPKKTEGYDIRAGVSMDQVVAAQLGRDTQVSSLELGIDPSSSLGSCDDGYSCTYTNTISWRTPTTPLPSSNNPRDVFERLFGDGDNIDKASRLAQLRRRSSLIDFVMADAKDLSKKVSVSDRQKLEEYLESIRDVEKRIQIAEKDSDTALPSFERPAGVPASFQDHVHLMVDLQMLAMQSNLTRVSSFMIGRELSQRTYPELGVPDAHHAISHHGNDPEKLAKLTKINTYHIEMLAYQLRRLKETKDGEGTLLDSTVVLAGPSFGNSNTHDHDNFPAIVAGGGFQGGRHIPVKDTPYANLLVSVMNQVGVNETKFGDSTGPLAALSA